MKAATLATEIFDADLDDNTNSNASTDDAVVHTNEATIGKKEELDVDNSDIPEGVSRDEYIAEVMKLRQRMRADGMIN